MCKTFKAKDAIYLNGYSNLDLTYLVDIKVLTWHVGCNVRMVVFMGGILQG